MDDGKHINLTGSITSYKVVNRTFLPRAVCAHGVDRDGTTRAASGTQPPAAVSDDASTIAWPTSHSLCLRCCTVVAREEREDHDL
jgi:hypothetical protein